MKLVKDHNKYYVKSIYELNFNKINIRIILKTKPNNLNLVKEHNNYYVKTIYELNFNNINICIIL